MSLTLYHFHENEFNRDGRNWFADMDERLLVLLDVFRFRWGEPVRISANAGAIGRILGPGVLSDHNFTRHGKVLAVDVMPEGIEVVEDARRAVELAQELAFTAIGYYPHWTPFPGLHLGTRPGRQPGDPATWGAIMEDGVQKYVSLEDVLKA